MLIIRFRLGRVSISWNFRRFIKGETKTQQIPSNTTHKCQIKHASPLNQSMEGSISYTCKFTSLNFANQLTWNRKKVFTFSFAASIQEKQARLRANQQIHTCKNSKHPTNSTNYCSFLQCFGLWSEWNISLTLQYPKVIFCPQLNRLAIWLIWSLITTFDENTTLKQTTKPFRPENKIILTFPMNPNLGKGKIKRKNSFYN